MDVLIPILEAKHGKQIKTIDQLAEIPPNELILLIAVGELCKPKRSKPIETELDFNLVLTSVKSGI